MISLIILRFIIIKKWFYSKIISPIILYVIKNVSGDFREGLIELYITSLQIPIMDLFDYTTKRVEKYKIYLNEEEDEIEKKFYKDNISFFEEQLDSYRETIVEYNKLRDYLF